MVKQTVVRAIVRAMVRAMVRAKGSGLGGDEWFTI
jgi:hypothetical protein